MFGKNTKDHPSLKISPTTLPIFCQRYDEGYTGDDVGLSEKVCNDFHITPTDVGMCLTKNLDIKNILRQFNDYEDLFEPKEQSTQRMSKGTTWGQVSIVFWLPDEDQKNSFKRKSKADQRSIQFLLHSPYEFAKMLHADTFDYSMISETLKANHEYFFRVTPYGQVTSEEVKALDVEQRGCQSEDESLPSSIFKIYRKKNCEYECKVDLATSICKCIPWDFISNANTKECDIFGRTCFYNAIENMTQSNHHCKHCIEDCDSIEFKRELNEERELSHKDEDFEVQGRYVSTSWKYGCKGEELFVQFFCDSNMTFEDRQSNNMHDCLTITKGYSFQRSQMYQNAIIVHLNFLKPDIVLLDVKYSLLDKLANFGGKFGIFAQLTGCSLLGILNIFVVVIKCVFSRRSDN